MRSLGVSKVSREVSCPIRSTYTNRLKAHDEVIKCGCGIGEVSAKVMETPLWATFAPFVTRFAFSPIYPVPYVNPIGISHDGYFTGQASESSVEPDDSEKCLLRKTTSDQLKKCGRCGVARYCSRECQAKDWSSSQG